MSLYISGNGFETNCTTSFSIFRGILSTLGDLDLFRALISLSTYPTLTVCNSKYGIIDVKSGIIDLFSKIDERIIKRLANDFIC